MSRPERDEVLDLLRRIQGGRFSAMSKSACSLSLVPFSGYADLHRQLAAGFGILLQLDAEGSAPERPA